MHQRWTVLISFSSLMASAIASPQNFIESKDKISTIQRYKRTNATDQNLNLLDNFQEAKKAKRDFTLEEKLQIVSLPNEIIAKIVFYMDDQNLLNFLRTSSQGEVFVEKEFKDRSGIKLPLSCLIDLEVKHPYPFMASYFVRMHLHKIFGENPSHLKTYKVLSEFSKKWNYVGKKLFDQIIINGGTIKYYSSFFNYLDNCLKNRDSRELELYLLSSRCILIEKNNLQNSNTYLLLTGSHHLLLSVSQLMTDEEKKEIAFFYLYKVGDYFFNKNSLQVNSYKCFAFCADQGDLKAQIRLGILLYEKGKIEKAKKYFKLAAEQGDERARQFLESGKI